MKYIKEFDGLRAFAVLAVMFQHYLGQHPIFSVFGSGGVTLFFVLSGFLITQILLKEKEALVIDYSSNKSKIGGVLKTFYARRSLRIFPIYYLTLLVLVILNIDSARAYFSFHVFYLSNILYTFYIPFDRLSHFWSLAVEEQFYLVWPIVILYLPLKTTHINFFSLMIIGSVCLKIWLVYAYSLNSHAQHFLMPCCIESFAAGGLAVELINKDMAPGKLILFSILGILLFIILQLLPVISSSGIALTISTLFSRTVFSLVSVTFLLLIIKQVNIGVIRKILLNKQLAYLGKISYGIYIYHMFVPGMQASVAKQLNLNLKGSGMNLILHFLITFIIAHLSYIIIEKPVNNLKAKFAYK